MPSQLENLILNPIETLAIECKDWIDPTEPEGKAKIVKACLAMWNSNGGQLLIGIMKDENDHKLKPNFSPPPQNVREQFDPDRISQLVSEHAFQKFEVRVDFVSVKGVEFPVLTIERGVRTINPAKKPLKSSNQSGAELIKSGVVYVRTLEANGSVSTSEARPGDWETMVEICFQNREADIGNFLRRHLTPNNLQTINAFFQGAPLPVSESLAQYYLKSCASRFEEVVKERKVDLPQHGAFEASFLIPGGVAGHTANRKFLDLLSAHNPNYWSWPMWINSTRLGQELEPQVKGDVWEAWIVALNPQRWMFKAIDFWRADPIGRFYHRRAFFDDIGLLANYPDPMTVLDPYVQMVFVAEAIVVGQAFSIAMGVNRDEIKLEFAFRWTKLGNRMLVSWLNPNWRFQNHHKSSDEAVSVTGYVPLDAAPSSIYQYVHEITKPLFRAFSGYEFREADVQKVVGDFLARKSF